MTNLAPHAQVLRLAGAPEAAAQPAPELTVIIPTFNERGNVALIVERLQHVLVGCDWEAIFVDDNSSDGTAALVQSIGEGDRRIRCLRRIGRRGLAGACLEGMLASNARYVAVIDADLQHDEWLLRPMLEGLRAGNTDVIVGTRYQIDGGAHGLGAMRAQISRWSSSLARRLIGVQLSDPMSGFFMIRRAVIDDVAPALQAQGFKILLDIVASSRNPLRTAELPYIFGKRLHGESKLDSKAALDFAALLVAKLTHNAVSHRFLLFCLVGLTGIAVHMLILQAMLKIETFFVTAQVAATVGAITWNFILNNTITYRDQRLVGWRFFAGFVIFHAICAIGAISNVGIAGFVFYSQNAWWLAGLAGALVGAVWNYTVSAAFVWKTYDSR